MALRDELPPKRQLGGKCTITVFLRTQPETHQGDDCPGCRPEWEDLLADPMIESSQIIVILKAHGYQAGYQPLIRHRRGGCACDTA